MRTLVGKHQKFDAARDSPSRGQSASTSQDQNNLQEANTPPIKKKNVTFNMTHKADDMIKNTSVKGIPQLGKKAGIMNQNCYSFSKIPKWDGIKVRSIDPKRANWLYRNAARLGSKIPRLNGLKEDLF